MTEGLQTVVTQSRPTIFDVMERYGELSDAIDGIAAVLRMHETERARLSDRGRSSYQVLTAWRNATNMLGVAVKAAEQVRDAILGNAVTTAPALNVTEELD